MQTLHRDALKGLHAVSLSVQIRAEGCDGSFLPVVQSKLRKSISDLLSQHGIAVDPNVRSQLVVEIRTRVITHQNVVIRSAKIETALREPVMILRNGLQSTVDTWRHRTVVGA